MSYFIFDMDETLAELYPMYYFISSLKQNIPKEEEINFNSAYNIFVKNILAKELSSDPIGILRPGIFKVMEKLHVLKTQGKVKDVVIYSNNGHLESIHFIRDLINTNPKTSDLIRECIDWNHPLRGEERLRQPGAAYKTWKVLKKILVEGNCGASKYLEPSSVYFFDDLDHLDLQYNLGPENYFKVPPYNFRASFDRIADEYRTAFTKIKYNNLEEDIEYFRSKTQNTVSRICKPPQEDKGIQIMLKAIGVIGGRTKKRKRTMCKKSLRADKPYTGKKLKHSN
jgi:hypothetical protein